MTHAANRRWPLAIVLLLSLAVLAGVAVRAHSFTSGEFTYALDDAYIHMSLAKNLSQSGVLGVTPFEFTSASSSPLWTAILTLAFKLFGVVEFIPLAITVTASIALLAVSDRVLRHFGVRDGLRFLGLFWVAFATPLAPIVFGGMEHPLQVLIDVAIVAVSVTLLSREDRGWDRMTVSAVVLAALAGSVRYEGSLLVGVIAVLFAFRRRWKVAAALIAAAVTPVVLYGLFSMSQGGFFLPNSVVVKMTAQSGIGMLFKSPAAYLTYFLEKFRTALPSYSMLATTTLLLTLQLRSRRLSWRPHVLFPLVAMGIAGLHLAFGDVGWFYRYTAYLLALLGIGVVLQLSELLPDGLPRPAVSRVLVALTLLAGLFAVSQGATRGSFGIRSTPWASKNVHDQMRQTAQFFKENPQFRSVAIGDIGAVSFYNDDLRILDLEGLAENGVPVSQLGRFALNAREIIALARADRAQVAVVFPDYFDLPAEWVKVGAWTISNNVVAHKDTVVFLAIPPTDPEALETALEEYSEEQLPSAVAVEIEDSYEQPEPAAEPAIDADESSDTGADASVAPADATPESSDTSAGTYDSGDVDEMHEGSYAPVGTPEGDSSQAGPDDPSESPGG